MNAALVCAWFTPVLRLFCAWFTLDLHLVYSAGGIGFVADVRRMNVALTRARCSLLVLCNAASLSRVRAESQNGQPGQVPVNRWSSAWTLAAPSPVPGAKFDEYWSNASQTPSRRRLVWSNARCLASRRSNTGQTLGV
jgi:hypothetical protein